MSSKKDLVLVGGGHSHVQVLRRLAMKPLPNVRLTVVLDTPVAVYSGMVPGFIAGQYEHHELEIDVVPLARRAGARVVLSAASGIDVQGGRIEVEGRPSIAYDIVSFDIGSTVAGLETPGVRQRALPTRPIRRFTERFEALMASRSGDRSRPMSAAVVGGGVGGVELAFTLQQRLTAIAGTTSAPVVLLHDGPEILPGWPPGLIRRVRRRAEARGIELRCGTRVVAVEEGRLELDGGGEQPFDLLAWVTGAAAVDLFRDSGLPVDERGFVRIRSTLQVEGLDQVFASGDCAILIDFPTTPKAGVYAVRQGPYLADNLVAVASGGALRSYRPQSDFLTLLNLGDGSAIGSKRGLSFEGRWVFRLKDRIDRRFMERFQVLDPAGASRPGFPPMEETTAMICGGCAAKVGQPVLERALERIEAGRAASDGIVLGLEQADDAAAYRTPSGDIVASTVDLFSAFTDDPFIVGEVAAVNAVSDLLAVGVEPRYALAIVAVPEDAEPDEAEELLFQTLSGARRALDELGVELVGGHTTTAGKLMVGFSVDGFAPSPESLLRLDGLVVGASLILTKALGTGVLFHADMQGQAAGRWLESALRAVRRNNLGAHRVAQQIGARGVTDVTGFGLVGHLGEMLRSSGVSARLEFASLPALEGAERLMSLGFRSTFHDQNEKARRGILFSAETIDESRAALLFDPQTSGGLLFGVASERTDEALERLHEGGDAAAAVIGRVVAARDDGVLIEIG